MTDIRTVLVDDDREWGETTARLLNHKRDNFKVEYTDSVEEATEMVDEEGSEDTKIDCILADYHMPGLDGIDFLEVVRESHPDLPFVLITAKGSEDVASEAITKQVTDYITKKPGEDQTETIANRVENAVRSYRAEKHVEELNRKIEELHDNASKIGECETRNDIYDEVAEAGVRVVGFDGVIALEATDFGFLVRAVKREEGGVVLTDEGEVLENTDETVEGRAHSNRRSVVSDTSEAVGTFSENEEKNETEVEVMATPLDGFGVLVAVSDGFDENDIQLAETLAEHAVAALKRVESRERIVKERDEKERMRSLLTSSSSRDEVEESVTEYLIEEEGYVLAWVGRVSDGVSPQAFARREEDGYLESVVYPTDTDEMDEGNESIDPGIRAAITGEVQVVDEIDEEDGDWASEGAENGYRSAAAVPLEHEGVLYGVLSVYSDEPDAFSERELETLEEFAESLSSAIKSSRIREGLTSDRPMRLEMGIQNHPLKTVSEEWDVPIKVNSAIPRGDDVLYQAEIGDTVPEPLSKTGDEDDEEENTSLPGEVKTAEIIDEHEDGARVRMSVEVPTPETVIADYGGMIETTEIEDSATVEAKLPRSVDVSEVANAVKEDFEGTRVTAKTVSHDDDDPLSEDLRIWRLLNEELTQKQFNALRTAYRNGYFERPRKTNATETAEILNLSRPTFVQHLRVAEKKILDHMIETR